MEKYEFRAKQPLWAWIPTTMIVIMVLVYSVMTGKYELGVLWLIYAAITFFGAKCTYTITPETFSINPGLGKTRKFLLKDITAIEKKVSGNSELKSIIVRYSNSGKENNFFEIKSYTTNVKGILNAIQDYCPAVPVR